MRDMWALVRAVLVAGLIAGTAMALFHSLATEPVIDQAIAWEEAQTPQGQAAPTQAQDEPVVSRDMQRGGLVLGLMLYGIFFGLLFGAAFPILEHLLPPVGTFRRALLAAAAALWTLGLFPFFKYPANPPGVGQPETIEFRQMLFLLVVALAVVGLIAACAGARWVGRRYRTQRAWAVALLVYAGYCLVVFLALPPNPDPVPIPADLLLSFRALSLAGLTLFWLVFGLVFAVLLRYFERGSDDRVLAPSRR